MAAAPSPDLRVLGPDDVATLRELLAVFADAFEDRATYLAHPPSDAHLRGLLASATFVAVVALAGSRVVGGLAGYVLPKFEQERWEFYIYDLAVAREQRRRGIATALLRRLQALAAERGWHVIYVQADRGDDPAIALYASLGTREDVLHFDIAPDPRAS